MWVCGREQTITIKLYDKVLWEVIPSIFCSEAILIQIGGKGNMKGSFQEKGILKVTGDAVYLK